MALNVKLFKLQQMDNIYDRVCKTLQLLRKYSHFFVVTIVSFFKVQELT